MNRHRWPGTVVIAIGIFGMAEAQMLDSIASLVTTGDIRPAPQVASSLRESNPRSRGVADRQCRIVRVDDRRLRITGPVANAADRVAVLLAVQRAYADQRIEDGLRIDTRR